ncbi:hypothetical protein SS50377_20599 [Spironucleus salmonicida]|uniref:Uncharacterized protein n=1 Tax=Spironucleus salmonicida TaxID=348837 RepID=V6LYH7_9EUKA|nr:hypothetical protein SS50377_28783 [Spironucleus salmonicida]KAH0577248.1 hypothetical protein SS50377_20599 [Spironucleus salmonicida]|eukprot:EST45869.1 hypothetical protein SS50377_14156 [Spironucleus salmonicida]
MTTVLRKSSTPTAVERFKTSFTEYQKNTTQQNEQEPQQEFVQEAQKTVEMPIISIVKRPQPRVTTSDPPTLFGYKRQDQLSNTKSDKFANQTNLSASRKAKILKESTEISNEQYVKQPCYNQQFNPTKQFIYTPTSNLTNSNTVSYQKAHIGQTSYLPIAGNSAETFWRTNWNKSQQQNDDSGMKAFVGYENLGNTFIINEQFTIDTTSGKVLDSEVNAPHGIQGKVHAVSTDMQSVTRKEFAALNNMAYEIAHSDKTNSHQRWLKDKMKPSPVPIGVKEQMQSSNQQIAKQFYRSVVVGENTEKEITLQKAIEAAVKMYGDSKEVHDWVCGLSATRVMQIAEIGEDAMQKGVMPGQDMTGKIPDWFYMKM